MNHWSYASKCWMPRSCAKSTYMAWMRHMASVGGATLHASDGSLLHSTATHACIQNHGHANAWLYIFLYVQILMCLFLDLYPNIMVTVAWRRGISHALVLPKALSWLPLHYCPCSLASLWLYWRYFGPGFPSTLVPQNKDWSKGHQLLPRNGEA